MYLTQPPFQDLTLHAHEAWYGGWQFDRSPITRTTSYCSGVTILDLFQHAEEMLGVRRIVDVHNAIGRFRNLRTYEQLEAMDGWWSRGKKELVLDLRGDYS